MIITCDLVLIPSKKLSDKAIKISELISLYHPNLFKLEYGKFNPHMSLYMFRLDKSDISKTKEAMSLIVQSTKVISASATNYYLSQGFGAGYIDVEFKKLNELKTLQDKVIETINPIRSGMRQNDIDKMQDARGLKLKNLQEYGYPSIGKLFRPHMTLTRLEKYNPEVLEILPDYKVFNGDFDKIGLFEMGPNGTCVREIYSQELT